MIVENNQVVVKKIPTTIKEILEDSEYKFHYFPLLFPSNVLFIGPDTNVDKWLLKQDFKLSEPSLKHTLPNIKKKYFKKGNDCEDYVIYLFTSDLTLDLYILVYHTLKLLIEKAWFSTNIVHEVFSELFDLATDSYNKDREDL